MFFQAFLDYAKWVGSFLWGNLLDNFSFSSKKRDVCFV